MFSTEQTRSFPLVENVEIELFVGEGASSSVFRGRQLTFDRTVAVKVLNVEKPQQEEIEKFQLEARILAKLEHQNIARIWQLGLTLDHERPYIVMEFVEGRSLSDLLKSGHRLNTHELRSIFLPLLQALKMVHDAGIVHRDLKPGNILLSENGDPAQLVPKLIDFGIAKLRRLDVPAESKTMAANTSC